MIMKDGTIYKHPRTNRFEAGLMVAVEQAAVAFRRANPSRHSRASARRTTWSPFIAIARR
jgi:hypothetical protein